MQVSHRLIGDRRKQSGHFDSRALADIHISLLDALPLAAAFVDQQGQFIARNMKLAEACASAGADRATEGLAGLLSSESWNRCEAVLSVAFNGVPAEAFGPFLLRSGAVFCTQVTITPIVSLAANEQAVLVRFGREDMPEGARDGSDGQPEEAPASDGAVRIGALLDHFPDDVLIFDGTESVERKAAMLLEAIGGDHGASLLAETLSGLGEAYPQTIYLPEERGGEVSEQAADRQMCEIRLVPIAAADGSGRTSSMAIVRHNVDCPHEAAENRRLAYQDPLTGLENRRAFTRSLTREMNRIRGKAGLEDRAGDRNGDRNGDRTGDGDGTGLAVFYIDLDEFKKVNDLGGHDAGDTMLQRVAACLDLTVGECGTAARIGGDEFAGMVPAASEDAALRVATRILDGFERIRLAVADRVFTIGGSIGVAFLPGELPHGDLDAGTLLKIADNACLRGKRFGGQSVQVQTVQAADCASCRAESADWLEPGSFRGNELSLCAMPIVDLRTNRTCGVEVLLRLQGERTRGLSSRAWISAAERSGFIAQVDAWTLDRILDEAERAPDRTLLTMNISADSARDPGFRDGLCKRLSANPLLASQICLELPEKDFLREPAMVEFFFRLVHELGCHTAIDDFAGHWPVLSRLTGLQMDWLKLESGLTRQVMEEPAKAAVLSGLVGAAHELGIKVIAKHVETEQEARLLRELGVEAALGFHFGKPKPWPHP